MADDPLPDLARVHGPVVTVAALRSVLTAEGIRWAVRAGRLRRVRRGVYRITGAPGIGGESVTAESVAVALGGVLSHLGSAVAHGLPLWRTPALVTVTVPVGSRVVAPAGVRVVRRALRPDEIDGNRTALARTALDCAAELPAMEALAVLDSALRDGALTREELLAAADRYRARREARARARWFAVLADPQAVNPLESAGRALALEAGLAVQPQVWIGQGEVRGRADLVDRRRRIALEFDGHEHHSSRADWARDVRRTTSFTVDGWLVLRFTWDDLRRRPGWTRRTMRRARALRDDGGTPPSLR